jgi:tetratricopeptide (TPR) repeat protein
MYTYKGTMTIKPTKETPDVLYYSCRNHPYMGGKIHIVDPGETVQIAKATPSASAATAKPQQTQVSAGDVNQKIMFADMLLKSKNSQTVMKSHISEAIDLHKQAMSELAAARVSLKSGDNQQAYKQADNAVELLKQSHKLVPNETALEHMKERYTELQASIKDFEASHKENYDRIAKKQGKEAAVDYDKAAVTEFINTAEQSAKDGDYLKANRNLEKAQRAITVAIHKMLNNQTIVYDLNFESAEEEYQYELRRFQGYEELVPIAVEQKKPKAGAKKLMESFVKKGTDLRDRAVKAAEAGDYPTAIAMLQDATKDVRRGLRMIGVMQ